MLVILLTCMAATAAYSQKLPDLIPFRYGDKWGYANQEMKIVIEPNYDKAFPFYGDIAVVQLHFKQGLIDRNGNAVTPLKYKKVGRYSGIIDSDHIPIEINGKYGKLDRKGKEIIPAVYDEITSVEKDYLYKVKSGEKYGLYMVGKGEVTPAQFDKINDLKEGVMVAVKGGKYGLLDKIGTLLVKPEMDYIWDFENGTTGWYKTGDKFGFLSNKGVLITGAGYDLVWSFVNGFARIQKGEKMGFINEAGKEIVPVEYDYFSNFVNGLAVLGKDGKYGFINPRGKFLTGMVYDGAWTPTEGLAKVKSGDLWGYINTKGKMVIPAKFENCGQFSEGMAAVVKDGKVGYINTKGEWAIQPQFENGRDFLDRSAVVVLNGKRVLIGTNGGILTPQPYDSIGKFDNGLAPCWLNGKEGRINAAGKEIVPPQYDEIEDFTVFKGNNEVEYLEVRSNGLQGVYKADGVKVLDAEYEFLHYRIYGGLVSLKKDGKCGFCDTLGKVVIPFEYDDVSGFFYDIGGESYTTAQKNGLQGVLNTKGETVIPHEYKNLFLHDHSDIIVAGKGYSQYGLISYRNEVIQPFVYVDHFCDEIDRDPSSPQFLLRLQPGYTSPWIYVNARGELFEKSYQRELVAAEAVRNVPVMRNAVMEKMTSASNGQQYEIYISLPFNYYKTNKSYPVVYLADGDMLQGIASETSRMMCFDNRIPEAIIVGIGYGGTFEDWYNKRIKDLTPTDDPDATLFPGGGGCENFYRFIMDELIPYVDKEFRVAGSDRTFVGYSLGGLFGAWMLFNKPHGTFNRYMLISPSLWWDNQLALKWEEAYAATNNTLPVTLFMSLSSSEWGTPETLNKTLNTRNYQGLLYTYEEIQGENHYSTFPAGFAKGISFLFKKERDLFMIK